VPRSNRFLVRIGLNISCLRNGMLLQAVLHGCTFVSFVYLVYASEGRPSVRLSAGLLPDMELGHWVTGAMGHLGHLSRPGHRVTGSSF